MPSYQPIICEKEWQKDWVHVLTFLNKFYNGTGYILERRKDIHAVLASVAAASMRARERQMRDYKVRESLGRICVVAPRFFGWLILLLAVVLFLPAVESRCFIEAAKFRFLRRSKGD